MFDLFLTDPPYNVNYHGTAGTIKNDKMKNSEYIEFLTTAFNNAAEYMKAGASFYVWHATKTHIPFETALNNAELFKKLGYEKIAKAIYNAII